MIRISKEELIEIISVHRAHEISAALELVDSEINYTDLITKLKARLQVNTLFDYNSMTVSDEKLIERKSITNVNPNR